MNNGLIKFFQKHPMSDDIVSEINRIHGVVGGLSNDEFPEFPEFNVKGLAGIVAIGLIGWFLYYHFKKSRNEHEGNPEYEINEIEIHNYDEICPYLELDSNNQQKLDKLIFETGIDKSQVTQDFFTNTFSLIKVAINEDYNFKAKQIGSGSYGAVYRLYDKEKNVAVAVKIVKHDSPAMFNEELVSNIGCNVLRVKRLTDLFFFMELASGSMIKFIQNVTLTIRKKLEIIDIIRKQILCLFDKSKGKYLYTDVKLDNILYKCTGVSNNFKIFLGDLGSAMKHENTDHIMTYKPAEVKKNSNFVLDTFEKKEKIISWNIGILLMEFVHENLDESVYEYEEDNLKFTAKYRHIINKNYGRGYGMYLVENPDLRPSPRLSVLDINT